MEIPSAVALTNEDIRFLPSEHGLNEFGYYYTGLYMLGNYARYFPDRWVSDVEAGSSLAVVADEFMEIAETRMALLTLSDLSLTYYVKEI